MFNFDEYVAGRITGHLTIHKRFDDGSEEMVFDDHNVIVSGMSVGLSMMFTGSGSDAVTDYQIGKFQVGASGLNAPPDSSTVYSLSGAIDRAGS